MKGHLFVRGVFVVGALALMIMIGLALAPSVGAGDPPIGSQAPTQTEVKKEIDTAPPAERQEPMPAAELGKGSERPMSVPDHTFQTRDDGSTPCVGFKGGGCDYWIDQMEDYGPG